MNINLINIGANNRDDYIKEHCIELRNNVQLVTEENIEQINIKQNRRVWKRAVKSE